MKNAFAGLTSRFDTAEEWLAELEDISVEIFKTDKQREQTEKHRTEYLRTIDQLRRCNVYVMGIQEEEEGEDEEVPETIMNCPRLMSDTKPRIHEAQWTLGGTLNAPPQKKYTQAYLQTTENQGKSPRRSWRKNGSYL